MGEVERYPAGSFCWIDLGTTDVEGAKAFYGGLLGWEFEDLPAPEGSYTMCRLRGRDVAGIHRHAEEEGTGWSSNVSVGDLDRATARARELGAEVLAEPFEVPGAGRTAVLRDPAGAVVSLWQAGGHAGAGLVNEVGAWNWNELVAPDLDRAKKFYGELFGWMAEDVPGPIPRTSFSLGELLVGGGHAPGPQEPPTPRWTVSFMVADADQAAAEAERLGGRVLLPPMDIPIGRFAVVADPAGGEFTAAHAPARALRGVDRSSRLARLFTWSHVWSLRHRSRAVRNGLQRCMVRPGCRCDPGETGRGAGHPDKDEFVYLWHDRKPAPLAEARGADIIDQVLRRVAAR